MLFERSDAVIFTEATACGILPTFQVVSKVYRTHRVRYEVQRSDIQQEILSSGDKKVTN